MFLLLDAEMAEALSWASIDCWILWEPSCLWLTVTNLIFLPLYAAVLTTPTICMQEWLPLRLWMLEQ